MRAGSFGVHKNWKPDRRVLGLGEKGIKHKHTRGMEEMETENEPKNSRDR